MWVFCTRKSQDFLIAPVAQLVEHATVNRGVEGSSPSGGVLLRGKMIDIKENVRQNLNRLEREVKEASESPKERIKLKYAFLLGVSDFLNGTFTNTDNTNIIVREFYLEGFDLGTHYSFNEMSIALNEYNLLLSKIKQQNKGLLENLFE